MNKRLILRRSPELSNAGMRSYSPPSKLIPATAISWGSSALTALRRPYRHRDHRPRHRCTRPILAQVKIERPVPRTDRTTVKQHLFVPVESSGDQISKGWHRSNTCTKQA